MSSFWWTLWVDGGARIEASRFTVIGCMQTWDFTSFFSQVNVWCSFSRAFYRTVAIMVDVVIIVFVFFVCLFVLCQMKLAAIYSLFVGRKFLYVHAFQHTAKQIKQQQPKKETIIDASPELVVIKM